MTDFFAGATSSLPARRAGIPLELLKLPVEERARVAQRLLETLDEEEEDPTSRIATRGRDIGEPDYRN